MKTINKQTEKSAVALGKQRSYNEIVEFLDNNWTSNKADKALVCMKQLDKAFDNISQKVNTILIAGSNGKSLTINFSTKLLREEGLNVGAFYAPHILTYNERFSINDETISNKTFTEVGNEVINAAQSLNLTPNTHELLTMMALVYFKAHNIDVAVLEVNGNTIGDATTICAPKIAAITRVTLDDATPATPASNALIKDMLNIVKPGSHVISADQSKLNLQIMLDMVQKMGGNWEMPIRKLSPLAYPFEQLHGRCAALAERIAQIYINNCAGGKDAVVVTSSLLTKQKGRRGRPTLEAKRQSEINPKRTMEQFWKDTPSAFQGRFQILDKEKPTLLLDTANNLDAYKNLLLGVKLLHYHRPLKGLTLIVGNDNPNLNLTEFFKLLRYFFKKTSGHIIFCPISNAPGQTAPAWDVEQVTNDTKSMKIKAKAAKNFKEAFESARKLVDERHGLVVITGSASMLTEYWNYKGVKKF